QQLGGPEACGDARALLDAVPPPADAAARARVSALRDGLAEAGALRQAGRYHESETLAARLVVEARLGGYSPALGEARLALGLAQMGLYHDAAARASFEDALPILAEAKDDARVAMVSIRLINSLGVGLSLPAEALALRPAAEAAVARAGGDPRQRALLL